MVLGRYLGRDVVALGADTFRRMAVGVHDAVILIWLGARGLTADRALVEAILFCEIVPDEPLAILVGGTGAESLFDLLLRRLDKLNSSRAIMTSFLDADVEECVSLLLQATWPAEDRFLDWKKYLIVTFDDASELEQAILNTVDQ